MWQRMRTPAGGAVLGGAVGLLLAGGVAYAVTSGSGQAITACAHRNSGALRVVGSADQCRENERVVQWNTRGPAGPRGLPGVSGIETLVEQSERDASDVKAINASCPPGKTVLGGGANVTSDEFAVPVALTASQFNATPTANAWFAQAIEMRPVESAWQVNAFVVCALAR